MLKHAVIRIHWMDESMLPVRFIRFPGLRANEGGGDHRLESGYSNLVALGFALSDIFNKEGHQIYHDLNRQNGQYDPKECDAQYTKRLNGRGSGVTYRTYFALVEKAGVNLKMYPQSRPKFEGFAPVSEEMARGVNAKKGGS